MKKTWENWSDAFAAMEKVVKSVQKRGLLENYQKDFFEFDRNFLQSQWTSEGKFIWVITPNGTHLSEIGLHKKQNEWALATIHTGYKNVAIFIVAKSEVKEITKEKAEAEIQQLDFHVNQGVVCNSSGDVLAYMHISPRQNQSRQGGEVRFTLAENKHYTNRFKHILSVIATSEMAKYYGSWFSCVDDIVFDD